MSSPSTRLVTPPPTLAEALPSRPAAFRIVGPAAQHARGRIRAPFGVPLRDDADAVVVALGPEDVVDLHALVRALPVASELPGGTLVVVLGTVVEAPSLTVRVLGVLGRTRPVARSLRSSALLLGGFGRLGAAIDPESRSDLAWGYVPARA